MLLSRLWQARLRPRHQSAPYPAMNTRCRFLLAVALLATGMFSFGFLFAQPAAQTRDRKESLAFLSKIAASLEVRLDDKRRAMREDEPVMRWTNTISHATDAALFIWMHEGRPVAAGTTFITENVGVGLEFQSLAQEYEGAIFAFVMDTDADVLLLIENRLREGAAGWEYALARANPYILKVWRDETLVWSQKRVEATSASSPDFFAGPFPLEKE